MAKRKHLGTVYDSYPAKNMESWLVTVIFKIVMMFVTSLVWLGVYWMGLIIVNFLQVNLLEQKSVPPSQMFQSTLGQGVYWGVTVAVCLYIIFHKSGARKSRESRHHEKYKGIYEANQR